MNVVVNKARHPQLANYIHSSLFALLPYIEKVFPFCSIFFLSIFVILLTSIQG